MRWIGCLLFAASLFAERPSRVLIIGIDGLSVKGLELAEIPNLKALMARGAFTLRGRGVMPTVSSPNWASLLSGAGPEQHGVTSNEWQRDKHEIDPVCVGSDQIFPTLFGVIHEAKPKLHLAAIYDWKDFGRLIEPSAPRHLAHVLHSKETTDAAIAYWNEQKPDLLFVHLDDVDHAGHGKGWEGEHYLAELHRVDALVGRLAAAAGPKSLVVLVADHGGTGTKHGNLRMNELQIPMIFAGPGVKAGELPAGVNNFDLAPTLTPLFGVKPHACWVGKPLIRWR
ncbi:alkaline phosphatase family protein [Bryobacter aggregatus]|uniref:alkaline phosphatase family protein n=1 Tax=Bryobacter aggregatus TaxID=360054 RepID=UPI00068D5855|nr:alkaline phosphatase family protein [Bryobacter aggregatus]